MASNRGLSTIDRLRKLIRRQEYFTEGAAEDLDPRHPVHRLTNHREVQATWRTNIAVTTSPT